MFSSETSLVNTILRSAIVPYTAIQMYELVNSVEEYPRFLPWCQNSEILSRSDTEVIASLEIAWSGIHKSFTTRNVLTPHTKIQMLLVTGPFKHLDGKWDFTQLGEHGCKINLVLDFEFSGGLIDKLFQPVFNHIANNLVDAFCKRAAELYGKR